MASTEDDFPRGGSVSKQMQEELNDSADYERDLFQSEFQLSEIPKKRKLTEDGAASPKKLKISAEKNPTFSQIISEGMTVLGCIREIHDYELKISLPDKMYGTIPIMSISDSYNTLLQDTALSTATDNVDESEVQSLHALFKIGMVLRCKVAKVIFDEKGKRFVSLTINPKEVNADLNPSSIVKGIVLSGSIASKEDHGYIVDIGVGKVKAFLQNKDAARYLQLRNEGLDGKLAVPGPPGILPGGPGTANLLLSLKILIEQAVTGFPFSVGQYCVCKVQQDVKTHSGLSRTVTVTVDPRKVADLSKKVPFNMLVPGMKFEANICTMFKDGSMALKFLDFTGFVHPSQMSKPKYETDKKVIATILYIHPTSKFIAMSLLPHLVENYGIEKGRFESLKLGMLLELPSYKTVEHHGVYFKIDASHLGFASIPNLPAEKSENITQTFKIGSTHKCRIMNFDYLSNVVILSLKPNILNREFLLVKEIQPGQIMECTVKEIKPEGVTVTVASNVTGFIPNLHLADVPLKHPEKKFKEGSKIKCRVLRVNEDRSNLCLTSKKSLVNSSYPVISSYEDLQHCHVAEGFVVKIKENGVLVAFYNNVKGWVPKNELSDDSSVIPEKLFYLGQVVRCQVKSVSLQENKSILTFKKMGGQNATAKLVADVQIGSISQCEVIDKNKSGLVVKTLPDGNTLLLPKWHLSDTRILCDLLFNLINKGDKIDEVVYHSKHIVSRKHSLINSAKSGKLIHDFEDIKCGMVLTGSVRNVMQYGVFVEFPGDWFGLAPLKFLADRWITESSEIFYPKRTILAKVKEIHDADKRFSISLRLSDCSENLGVAILKNYLRDYNLVSSYLKGLKDDERQHLTRFQVGDKVTVTVTDQCQNGVICVTENGVKAFVSDFHLSGHKVIVKQSLEGVVLHVDLVSNCLEFSLRKDLCEAAFNKQCKKFTQVKVGQILKSEVILIQEEFILVSLPAAGKVAYLPSSRNWNDIVDRQVFILGEINEVVINSMMEDGTIVVALPKLERTTALKSEKKCEKVSVMTNVMENGTIDVGVQRADKKKTPPLRSEKKCENVELKVGDCIMAKIKDVLPRQVNITCTINGKEGRIHVTEVVDKYIKNRSPFSKFKEKQEVVVRVIGFRERKNSKESPSMFGQKSFIECSCKKSVFSKDDLAEDTILKEPSKGEQVLAFLHKIDGRFLWMDITTRCRGKVCLSKYNDNKILKNLDQKFKVGHCYKAKVLKKIHENLLRLDLNELKPSRNINKKVSGVIKSIERDQLLIVAFANGKEGFVGLTDIMDDFKDFPVSSFHVGQHIDCAVVHLSKKPQQTHLSLRKSRLVPSKKEPVDADIHSLKEINKGDVLRGFIIACSSTVLHVCVGHKITGVVQCINMSKYRIAHPQKIFTVGKVVTAKVISIHYQDGNLELSLLEKDTGVSESITHNTGISGVSSKPIENQSPLKRRKRKTSSSSTDKVSPDKKQKQSSQCLQLEGGFTWDTNFSLPDTPTAEHDDSDEELYSKKQELSTRSKKDFNKMKAEEEKHLYELEMKHLQGKQSLDTAEDYDRLVLQSPNSSIIWLRYMAFHLETSEIEKARSVAERALNTISYREEQEKLNVWVAYFNLENMYGTSETLNNIVQKALKQNDPYKVYQHIINIYEKSGKIEDAEMTHNTLVRKFSLNKDVWTGFGLFYYKIGKIDSARKLMQRSFKSLPNKEHVEVISKFAQMDFKYGDSERGKTMYENVLSNYPKRTDLWSVYIDMIVKYSDTEAARLLFERVISMKFSAKKMKFFFKKYLDFEMKHGNEETVDSVKQKALTYVDSQGYMDE